MFYRVTSTVMNAQAIQHSQRLNLNLAQLQRDISSGVKIHRPSDNPIAFRQTTSLQARKLELDSELFTAQDATSKLNFGVSQLLEANQLITTAKVLTQEGIQALSSSERNAMAIEVESLLERMKNIALSKNAGHFIFSGTRTDVPPFEFSPATVAGHPLTVNYQGSVNASQAFVGPSVTVDTLFPGHRIFGQSQRGPTEFFGNTGAKPGVGTDNMIGQATLLVRHSETNFQPGSGIQTGTDSPGGDTILGNWGTHNLRIVDTSGNGSAGFLVLNGGEPVPFTNSNTNLEVIGGDGGRMFVNTTSMTPGFDGVIEIQATGTLSVDGGMTSTPIDFTTSQRIVDSSTGTFMHVDSTQILRTGNEYLEFPGTSNIFQVLHGLAQDLRESREFDSVGRTESLSRRLGELEAFSNQILDVVGVKSASLSALRRLEERIQEFHVETDIRLTELQATDVPTAILKMRHDQLLLETTYSVTANLMSIQLINFLR